MVHLSECLYSGPGNMLLQLLLTVCLSASLVRAKGISNFDHFDCAQVPEGTSRWKAIVSLTRSVHLIKVTS